MELGASQFVHLSRSRRWLSVFWAQPCCTATKEQIERGMKARCAAWFRLVLSQPRVVQAFVVLARFRSMLRAYQGDSKARYAAWFRVVFSQPCVVRRLVMLNWFRSAWFGQAQLLVSSHRGRHMPELGCLSTLAPNTRLQRTPLRVVRDRAFFIACICYNVSAINRGGAAKAQPVGCAQTQLHRKRLIAGPWRHTNVRQPDRPRTRILAPSNARCLVLAIAFRP